MKNFTKILIFSLFAITTYAQQATEIDSKSVRLPRYANLAAITNITTGITTPTQGMMVYNIETASNWYYNGAAWKDNNSTPYPLIVTGTTIGATGNTSITGESIVTYPTIYSGPDLPGGTGVYGISDGGIYGIGVRGQGNGPFHVGVSGVSNYRGVQGGSTSGIGVYGNSLNGISGKFEIDNFTNSSDALHAITTGTGSAGLFEINNALNSNHALIVNTNGLGRSGWFQSTNSLNNAASLIGENYGLGQGVYGTNFGTGKAGVFEINNTSNANIALEARTNGLGRAGYFVSSNTTNNSEALFTTQFGLGKGGFFEIYNGSNNNTGLHSLTNGTGKAGLFVINNTSNLNYALEAQTNGLGRAGSFFIDNTSNNAAALRAESNGTAQAIYGSMNGTGKAGVFEINNGTNSNIALHAITNGTGKAAYFQGTNALETNGSIKFGGSGVGIIGIGKVLTSDALGGATWQDIPAVAAPLILTSNSTTLNSAATGTSGNAGYFKNYNTSNSNEAVYIETRGSGSALQSYNSGTGSAGNFIIYNALSSASAIEGSTNGTGRGAIFSIQNATNASNALYATTNGTGKAAYFQGTNALETNGTVKFAGSGVGTISAGKVLTSDASGGATWQAIPAITAPLNLTSSVTTLQSIATGASGFAGDFQITNTSNAANALSSTTTGTGKAAFFQGTNALETNGTIKFGGAGVGTIAAGKVLTSDAVGNATWQVIPAVTAPLSLNSTATTLTSTSTVGTAANFSSTSGYALVTGTGNVGIGTSIPTAKLEVSGQAKINNGSNISIDASNSSSTNPTIKAVNNTNLAPAIDIAGGIKVSGTNKAAFKIVTGPFISGNKTGIPNTTLANAATDILVVTYEFTGGSYLNKQFSTFWNGGNWEIHLTDSSAMPTGIAFNVLVIKQ